VTKCSQLLWTTGLETLVYSRRPLAGMPMAAETLAEQYLPQLTLVCQLDL
jgi:hypothetical protein